MNNKEFFMPKAVVFDMDGLMFDSERVVMHSWNIVGNKMGYGNLGDDNIRFTLGMNRVRRRVYFKEKYGEDFPYDEFQEEYAKEYQRYAKENGVPIKTGLYELIQVLKERNIPMAVATSSSREHAFGNLKRAGIEDEFQSIITGDMVKESKPAPEVYEKSCELLGVDPSNAFALEDAANGIISAYRAGMYTILVPDLLNDFSKIEMYINRKADSLLEIADWIVNLEKKGL